MVRNQQNPTTSTPKPKQQQQQEQDSSQQDSSQQDSSQQTQPLEETIQESSKTKKQDEFDYKGYTFQVINRALLELEQIPYFDHDYDVLYQNIGQCAIPSEQVQKQSLTLKQCLDAFTEFEMLNLKNNFFKCEKCAKKKQQSSKAIRKFFLYDTPRILTLVLKRFSQKSTGRLEKITEQVEFEEYLDISKYILPKARINTPSETVISEVLEKQIYKLFGVVVHSGTMSGGHYVAYVRHQEQYTIDNNLRGEDHWFYYSDTTYKEVPLRNVLNAQAYMLFYEKCL